VVSICVNCNDLEIQKRERIEEMRREEERAGREIWIHYAGIKKRQDNHTEEPNETSQQVTNLC
jgi:hypothetical protein